MCRVTLDRLVVEPDEVDPEPDAEVPPPEPEEEQAAATAPAARRLIASGRTRRVAVAAEALMVI
jgi:hypothetical protein